MYLPGQGIVTSYHDCCDDLIYIFFHSLRKACIKWWNQLTKPMDMYLVDLMITRGTLASWCLQLWEQILNSSGNIYLIAIKLSCKIDKKKKMKKTKRNFITVGVQSTFADLNNSLNFHVLCYNTLYLKLKSTELMSGQLAIVNHKEFKSWQLRVST